jgi:hypothetical protein
MIRKFCDEERNGGSAASPCRVCEIIGFAP